MPPPKKNAPTHGEETRVWANDFSPERQTAPRVAQIFKTRCRRRSCFGLVVLGAGFGAVPALGGTPAFATRFTASSRF